MADVQVSDACDSNIVRVQIPSPAPNKTNPNGKGRICILFIINRNFLSTIGSYVSSFVIEF